MALAISTNNAALNAAASASSVNREMETSMARLSSGKRINSASDDAAGVAISSRLSAEIRGTDQAIRNSMDGQALIDTAEGAHQEIENILQRMREVSVQASNDTNNDQDRANLQAEMDAMIVEVDRIAATTTWAGENLMQSATGSSFSFQVGAATGSENQISINIQGMGAKNLGLAASSSAERATNTADQATYDGLVATENTAVAAASTAADTKVAADVDVANLEIATAAELKLTMSLDQEKAAGIRDIMNTASSFTTSANIVDSGAKDGIVSVITKLQAEVDVIDDADTKSTAQDAVTAISDAVAAFKATTTDSAAATAYATVITKITAAMIIDTSASSVNGAGSGAAAATLGADAAFSTNVGADEINTITESAAAFHTVVAADDLPGAVTAADTAVTDAKAALVVAEDAASTATAARKAAVDPANLQGQDLSVTTGDNARDSIVTIDAAIKTVNIQRSELGAVSNRLNHTVNNLTNISSNLSAAKGGIEDADFALETTNLAKNQILQQASTAMLAQANASKQNVLSLLQG